MASVWLCQAAAGATAFILTDALLPDWEWRGIDLAATSLNVSGSALAGLAKGGARVDNTVEMQAALAIFMSGFLSVWTSLTFTVEHAAQLAVENGLWSGVAYLLGSVFLGTAVYLVGFGWGRRWRVSRKAVDWARKGPLRLFSGVEKRALLCTVLVVAWGGWMIGRPPANIGWGVTMAIAGGLVGNWFSGLDMGTKSKISWGSWRCNALAFAGTVTAARYVARLELEERKPVLESAFFMALVNQGLGTVSGFSDLSACVGDLALAKDYGGAAANIFLNVATAGVALVARMRADTILLETQRSD